MLEEIIIVTAVKNHQIWGQKQTSVNCQACINASECTTLRHVSLSLNSEVSIGDKLLIGVEKNAIIKVSLIIYLLPLLVLFFGAGVGFFLEKYLGLSGFNEITIIIALSFFLITFPLLRTWMKYRIPQARLIQKL